MKVKLRNPDRVVDVSGPSTVLDLLQELRIVPESVLVIRDATLLTRDERLSEDDELEVRPVLSGGASEAAWRRALSRTALSPRLSGRRATKEQAGGDEAPPVAGPTEAASIGTTERSR